MSEFRIEEDSYYHYLLFRDTSIKKPNTIASVKLRLDWPHKYYIGNLYVSRSERRKGYATRLMQEIVQKYNDCELFLYAVPFENKDNSIYDDYISPHSLVEFYKSFGFVVDIEFESGAKMRRMPQ